MLWPRFSWIFCSLGVVETCSGWKEGIWFTECSVNVYLWSVVRSSIQCCVSLGFLLVNIYFYMFKQLEFTNLEYCGIKLSFRQYSPFSNWLWVNSMDVFSPLHTEILFMTRNVVSLPSGAMIHSDRSVLYNYSFGLLNIGIAFQFVLYRSWVVFVAKCGTVDVVAGVLYIYILADMSSCTGFWQSSNGWV